MSVDFNVIVNPHFFLTAGVKYAMIPHDPNIVHLIIGKGGIGFKF